MNALPFWPLGNTEAISATTSAATAKQPLVANVRESTDRNHYRFVNAGAVTVFLGVGASASDAQTAAAVATGLPILPGAVEILRFEANSFFSAITASGSATLYVTAGEGI